VEALGGEPFLLTQCKGRKSITNIFSSLPRPPSVSNTVDVKVDMPPKAKKDAESNGRQVDDDGNQKIDSLMEKAEPVQAAAKEEPQDQDDAESHQKDTSKKREKGEEEEEGTEDVRPKKTAKKEEEGAGAEEVEGEAAKAKEVPDEKLAAVLEPGAEEDMDGDDEGSFKVLERGQ
jgi:cobalamin biosynthesis protein CobT